MGQAGERTSVSTRVHAGRVGSRQGQGKTVPCFPQTVAAGSEAGRGKYRRGLARIHAECPGLPVRSEPLGHPVRLRTCATCVVRNDRFGLIATVLSLWSDLLHAMATQRRNSALRRARGDQGVVFAPGAQSHQSTRRCALRCNPPLQQPQNRGEAARSAK
jgi:hypothetical protein